MGAAVSETSVAGHPALALSSPSGRLRATFVPGLNMLCPSLLHDGDELLHLRAGVEAYAERGKTCGIPFLHPWANRLAGDRYEAAGRVVELRDGARPIGRDANGLPNHGLLGGRTAWELASASAGERVATLVARLAFTDPALLANFPYPHEVTIAVTLDDEALSTTTMVEPATRQAVPVSFGFHPYLRLPGIPREDWVLTLPVRERLVLDPRGIPTGERTPVRIDPAPLGSRAFDDGFTGIESPRVFALEGGGRRVELEFDDGFPFVQVFAPEGSGFVCIEPMTAPANALVRGGEDLPVVAPGSRFSARWTVRIR